LFDSLTVIKGPQSVQYGAGNSAATIVFERQIERFTVPGYRLHASALAGSFGRFDEVADVQLGNTLGYLQLGGTDSRSGDYKDGAGNEVHSEYHRYNANASAGWTPDDDTRLEVAMTHSDGEAAYADRGMDGTKFLRESGNLSFQKKNISPLFEEVKFNIYDSQVDHIMDDQELRKPGMMGYANLKRDTSGGRIAGKMQVSNDLHLTIGADTQGNTHESRKAPVSHIYTPWQDDADISQTGLFAELDYSFGLRHRIVTGYRADEWKATDPRAMVDRGMMPAVANPTYNDSRKDTLSSGFARYEHKLAGSATVLYGGFGRAERFPDYWEMIAKESATTASAFYIKPEQTSQIDIGSLYKADKVELTVSAFYNRINDFILVDYSSMMKMSGFSRNIDATTYGMEAGASYDISSELTLDTSLAYMLGFNDTDDTYLAQLPPLEARMGMTYALNNWSVGGLVRAVDDQDHYDVNKGNIVGKDLGPSAGFAVFSLNAGWRPVPDVLGSIGIDNLFNRDYAEFISRSSGNGMGGAIPGYAQTLRVNEPGRTLWLKVQVDI
jgi:iron complex outermembrane receptor protein